MVFPLLKVRRVALKTVGKSFSTSIKKEADRAYKVGVVALIFGVRGHVRLRAKNTKRGKLLTQEIEELKEELRQMEKAKGGGVSEAKISRD